PASSTIRVARICTGRARLEQTELKKRKKGGWWTAHHHPARGVCRQTEGGPIIAPPFGGGFNGEYSAAYKPPARWGPYARGRRLRHHQTRPYETRPCLSWKQPHPRKGRATLMRHIGE